MNLNDILAQLGVGSREIVYLSVTPGVGLELTQLDAATRTIKNYNVKPINYNESLKEIADVEQFKESLISLFAETGISPKCSVVMSVPVVHVGIASLPLILGDDAVNEALTSEVEQVYLFKKTEPVIKWIDLQSTGDVRKILYGALQKSELEKMDAALKSIGAKLASVEFSLTSIIRALAFSGIADAQMQENVSWDLMVVNQNGYYLCPMINQSVTDYYEEPIPIKSFEGEEAYNALSASAHITLMNFPASYLYIISETDLISAEILSKKVSFEGTKFFIDNNTHKKTGIVPASLNVLPEKATKISLEAIGISASNIKSLPLKLDFQVMASGGGGEIVAIKIGNTTIELTPEAAQKIALMIAGVLIGLMAVLMTIFPMITNSAQPKLDQLNSEVTQILEEYKMYDDGGGGFSAEREIEKVMESNRTKLMAYSALGETVPKSLWITYFIVKDKGKIDIKGQTSKVDDVYTFYKNMKNALINSQLRLHKLELVSDSDAVVALTSDTPVIYAFEITNMSDAELTELAKPAEPAQPAEGAPKEGAAPEQPLPDLEPVN